jgi:hypothetical protein
LKKEKGIAATAYRVILPIIFLVEPAPAIPSQHKYLASKYLASPSQVAVDGHSDMCTASPSAGRFSYTSKLRATNKPKILWFDMLETSQPSSSRVALRFQLLLVLASFIQISSCLDASASVTIDQLPAYSQQRQCGKDCIQNNYDGGNDVEHVLGCTWNGCYCGTQYQAAATSIITSCWSAYCGASDANLLTYDISTAVSIYDAYCGVAVAAATGVTVPGWFNVNF